MHKFATALLLCASACAQAFTLDFGNAPGAPAICSQTIDGLGPAMTCNSGSALLQSHGDVPGVVDIAYIDMLGGASPRSLLWWETGYSNLYGVVWSGGSDSNSWGRIELRAADPAATVTLQSLDMGAWPNTIRGTTLQVFAIGGGSPLFSYAGDVGSASNQATAFAPGAFAVGGLAIEWRNSAYNVGIDNIEFTVSAVPEPGSALMLAAGAGWMAWRRRRSAAR